MAPLCDEPGRADARAASGRDGRAAGAWLVPPRGLVQKAWRRRRRRAERSPRATSRTRKVPRAAGRRRRTRSSALRARSSPISSSTAADNRDMREAIERFMAAQLRRLRVRRGGARDVAGHPLEWTRILADYLALVEQQLERFFASRRARQPWRFSPPLARNAVEDGDLSATQIMPGFLHAAARPFRERDDRVREDAAGQSRRRALCPSDANRRGSRLQRRAACLPARAALIDERVHRSRNLRRSSERR